MYSTTSESEDAGLYYMVTSLLPLAFYFDFVKPAQELNDIEAEYIKKFAISELKLLLFCPSMMFLGFCVINWAADPESISMYSSCFIIFVLIPMSMLGHSSGILKLLNNPPDLSIRRETISSIIGIFYIIATFALFAFICAVSGPVTFNFVGDSEYEFPTQEDPPSEHLFVGYKDDAYILIDANRGYFTLALYNYAPPTIFLITMFFLSHLFLTVISRCIIVTVVTALSHFVEG
ncbi:unnamed protein product [Orchesella dallaii]|uniref:Uncharacterized protein n=1 Tax=Orchesella dallaii TaxID=48710 RepID=A0ABP1QIT5_9HEXA